jgi:hypothetical protein
MLIRERASTEEIAEFIVSSTKSTGRGNAPETMHASYSSLDTAMILFQSIIEIHTGPVLDVLAELGVDRPRIGIVSITGDPIRNSPGHRLRGPKEPLGSGQVTPLAQHHINQRTIAIDRPVEIAPSPAGLDVGLIHVGVSRRRPRR